LPDDHQALDTVERAKSHQQRPGKQLVGLGQMLPVRRTPEDEQPGDDEQVDAAMEDAIP
jgi:hypothetical protein